MHQRDFVVAVALRNLTPTFGSVSDDLPLMNQRRLIEPEVCLQTDSLGALHDSLHGGVFHSSAVKVDASLLADVKLAFVLGH